MRLQGRTNTFWTAVFLLFGMFHAAVPTLKAGSQVGPSELRLRDTEGNHIVPGTVAGIGYREVEGQVLRLDAYLQPGRQTRPGIIIVHGGGWISGSRIAFVGQFMELLTGAGYNWFSVDYRLGPEAAYPAALKDLEAALEFVHSNATSLRTDPRRIAVLGEDAGAHLALMLAAAHPTQVAAVVSLGGFFDLQLVESLLNDRGFRAVFGDADRATSRSQVLKKASPAFAIKSDFPPTLLIHGSSDSEVPLQQARRFADLLGKSDVIHRLIEVQGGIHRPENWRPSQWGYKRKLLDWLAERLGPLDPVSPTAEIDHNLKKDIVYGFASGPESSSPLLLDAYIPDSEDPVPAVILVHGGGWEAGDKVTYLTPVLEPLAKSKLAWFSIDYRLTPQFRNWDQLEDIRRAIRFVRHHADTFHIDPVRIALLGESAGGQLVVQVAALPCPPLHDSPDPVEREPCRVQAVVSFYGVYDFLPMIKDLSPRSLAVRLFGISEMDERSRKLLRDYSPVNAVHAGMPPILLINGTGEFLWQQAVDLSRRLKALNVDYHVLSLEGAPHGMENWEGRSEWQHYKTEMADWLIAKLR